MNTATLERSVGSCVVHELLAEKVYGRCGSCGLPLRDGVKAMHIAGLPGMYHSVLCAEQAIMEKGCHFCGKPLASKSHRFCSGRCDGAARVRGISGERCLIIWLAAHSPELLAGFEGSEEQSTEGRKCAYCGGSLSDKRRDAKYCSDRCQKAYERSRTFARTRKRQTSQETPTATLYLQEVTDTQNTQTVLLVG
jgi:endogenous inhibitor of DNA gyrase (YacG/DUF329 family)